MTFLFKRIQTSEKLPLEIHKGICIEQEKVMHGAMTKYGRTKIPNYKKVQEIWVSLERSFPSTEIEHVAYLGKGDDVRGETKANAHHGQF